MNRMVVLATLLTLGVAGSAAARQQQAATEGKAAKWDVSARHAPVREVDFVTDEGTWMSVSVSPDGRRIAFDLLGDIYVMPIEGGEATQLTSGPAYDVQPRFSPDGRHIAFTSDRDGLDNLWIMDADGSSPRQITKERERQVNSPIWTPDGMYLIGRKHYRNTRSLGAGEMWLYHIGGGSGLQLTKRRNWEQNAGEPSLSPDGRYLYYSEDISPGGGFQYNRDPHAGIYAIQRLDRETGRTETWIRGTGGAVRPEVSPDGRTLAFVRRVGPKSVLFLQDIESGRERPLFDRLDHDQQEAWAIFGVYPHYSWTPDSRYIVIWAQGRIWKVAVDSGEAEMIPFRARVHQTITEALRFPQEVAPDSFDVRMLRWVSVAPDGKSVVYTALGKLWIRPLPGGRPRRLTDDESNWELYPSWSPDGRSIVYVTWNDDALGAVRVVRADGRGGRTLTTRPGHYVEPSFSRDGQQVVYRRIGGDALRGRLYSHETGIYRVPAAGGAPVFVTAEGSNPRFNRTGDRIFLTSREQGQVALISVTAHGADRRVHLLSRYATEIVPSPDERYVAWVERYRAHLAPLPHTGQPVTIGPGANEYPVTRLTRDAGMYLHWSPASDRVYWSLGPYLYERRLEEAFAFLREAGPATTAGRAGAGSGEDEKAAEPVEPPEAPAQADTAGRFIGFKAATDRPDGTIALVGATVVTMRGDVVLRDATIVVERNRITAVGPAAQVEVPAGARRIDVAGYTIIPGIIDVHAHVGTGSNGITPQTHWVYYANLAFGVTTLHDPSSNTEMVFSNAELIRAGELVAPRLFSTGTVLYGGETASRAVIEDYEDALSHLRRMHAVGAFTVKSYIQPRRDQRQQIIEAARELKMMVVPEGSSTFYWNMTHVLDGHTGIEHNIPVAPLYRDVLQLMAASGTGYTPTLIVSFGGLSGEYYWYQHSNVWENERLLRFVPKDEVVARSRRRVMAAEDDYFYQEVSRAAKALLDAGGHVQLGAHGQLDGLGAHWELWMLVQGGMTPHEALRAATLHGAEYLGLDRDLGSIEPGKLADLVVLEKNPLENIRNSTSIRYVMVNGRLYDGLTMNEVGGKERGRFPWER
ncbi:MAG TPA: amidohydrolase family protein [Longimicrobiales bacterium]